ncbi:MAG: leucyl aminopeptidase [Pseudomonadales bacterium]|jgi:leucyl aminopeptidase|nr:leucyl aminopeptidase [Pseudomonadales bacterium]
MKFAVKSGKPESVRTGCLVLPVRPGQPLQGDAGLVNAACDGRLQRLVDQGELGAAIGQTLMLHELPGLRAERVLLVSIGEKNGLDDAALRKIARGALTALLASRATSATVLIGDLEIDGHEAGAIATEFVHVAAWEAYRFNEYRSEPGDAELVRLTEFALHAGGARRATLDRTVKAAALVAAGTNYARTLGNHPGNVCTPSYLASEARRLAQGEAPLKVRIVEEKQMRSMGMEAFLAVSAGSAQPAKLIVMEYLGGAQRSRPIVLVGKGITFDTGGISLKPGAAMDEMKFDMCGAASVFGTIQAVAALGLAINVVGLVAAAENMPSGTATRPGDIVRTMSGQTVEILNTDAEGRLVLCDTLTYAERYKPEAVVDVATLTGAAVVALGNPATALFANDDELAAELLAAGEATGDRAWRMPLWDDYQQQLKSNFADMANIGGREAGSVTAACFLSRFARSYAWAHLDIAGSAWNTGARKGATGRPVRLLTEWLIRRSRT